jgi:uncharacterized protein involved in exopolysaccharide biosynthesis
MNDEFSLEDFLIVLRRRLLHLLAPVAIIVPIGLVVIMLLPPTYVAEGKIMVEGQQIPEEWVQTTVERYAAERIQAISQRVMTRDRLLEISDKLDLYPKALGLSEGQRVGRMRQAISVNTIVAESSNRRRREENTIAFTVGCAHRSPDKAFQCANEVMTHFLSEDVRTRTEGAQNATEFFTQETRRLAGVIDDIEARIADFKAKNADALPENLDVHRQTLLRSQEELARVQSTISLAEEELSALQTQISSYLAGSGAAAGPAQELMRLKTQLAALRADKTDNHPDVRATRDQIRALERQLAPSGAIQKLRKDLADADQALREARAANPVDEALVRTRREAVNEARVRLSTQFAREATAGTADLMMTQMQGRLDMTGSRLSSLQEQEDALRQTIVDLEDRIARTPSVERGLSTLTRDYQGAMRDYEALKNRQSAAVLSENLEGDQKAEKFSILESAQRPDRPARPKRLQLAFLLIAAACFIGAACAFFAELAFATVRGKKHLATLAGEAPIAVIPYIKTANEPRFPLPLPERKRAA